MAPSSTHPSPASSGGSPTPHHPGQLTPVCAELLKWRSVVRSHKLTLEHAAVDIDTYHMELVLDTPMLHHVLDNAEFLCLTWPYGGLWRIERILDNNTRVQCLSWRMTELKRDAVDKLTQQVEALARQVESRERPIDADDVSDEDVPTLFDWKMMRGEWESDASHWFIRNVRPPAIPAASSSERLFIAKLFVDVDPMEARIDVNAVTAIDTVAQTYAADVTWRVTLPAITALRDNTSIREFLDIMEIDPSQFEFINIKDKQEQRPLTSSLSFAGEAEFRDSTIAGDHTGVEDVYDLQFSRRVVATFTEEKNVLAQLSV